MRRSESRKRLIGEEELTLNGVVKEGLSEEMTCNLKHEEWESPSQADSYVEVELGGETMCRDPGGGDSVGGKASMAGHSE